MNTDFFPPKPRLRYCFQLPCLFCLLCWFTMDKGRKHFPRLEIQYYKKSVHLKCPIGAIVYHNTAPLAIEARAGIKCPNLLNLESNI